MAPPPAYNYVHDAVLIGAFAGSGMSRNLSATGLAQAGVAANALALAVQSIIGDLDLSRMPAHFDLLAECAESCLTGRVITEASISAIATVIVARYDALATYLLSDLPPT
jgi:hypothetical protein